ncbi:hypothetical protein SAMN04488095_1484 [Jannaschia pohangensis]|uniref:Uncharacterized protein n=1 Tax=Jannaschia pohangensis TaxID=390807 RepID=A0A1I3JZT9_9RHOB|nr:hypothetical protein SAMN04488095_1484 [Jannaschia pohangensis]
MTELWDVNVIHTSLLDLLGREHVERDLLLGTVTNKKGHVVEGWHTVIGRERLILRGNPHFWKGKAMFGAGCCKECGLLHCHGAAPRYLCPGPTSDRVIRQSDTTCLIIPASLKEAINLKRGSGYALEKLPVLESPRDGMPIELSCEPGKRIETTLTG